jgi:CubicO group peptidase (beta-lactamase class C family)
MSMTNAGSPGIPRPAHDVKNAPSGPPTLISRRDHHALFLATLVSALTPVAPAWAAPPVVFPGRSWENADPAKAGWSVPKLQAARDYAAKIGSAAVMVVQDGRVIAAWGDVERKMEIHSMRKGFMSALYGIAVSKRQVDLDKTLGELGIDDKPPSLTTTEKKATIRDLLKARSGVYHLAAYESESMEERRPERGSHAPGTFWYYNNWDFNVLGVLLRRATGEDTFAAVDQYLARPLQMQDFTPADGRYVTADISEHPAYPMRFTACDLARFGWLYLNAGRWRDQQVVPAQWVAESTKAYSDANPGIGYGYMWWVSTKGVQFRTQVGPGAFSARGHGGQYIVVAPAHRVVVVHMYDRLKYRSLELGEFGNLLRVIFDAAPKLQ